MKIKYIILTVFLALLSTGLLYLWNWMNAFLSVSWHRDVDMFIVGVFLVLSLTATIVVPMFGASHD